MHFHVPSSIDPLPTHAGSLRLLRSGCASASRPTNEDSNPVMLLQQPGMSLSSWIHATIYRPINLQRYLTHGLTIVSRLPHLNIHTTQFIPETFAPALAHEALTGIINLGSVYCGEGVHHILSAVSGNASDVDTCLEAATQTHFGRAISVTLAYVCRKVAPEYDAMASVMSLDEASDYLFSRFMGDGRIVTLAKLLLRTGSLLDEDSRNISVVTRGHDASMRSFSFLWNDAVVEARPLINTAKEMIGATEQAQQLQDIDFWDMVDRMSNVITRPLISLDAVVEVALAELGIVVNCHPEGISVLRAIAGQEGIMITKPVSLTNPESVWIAPFRALTINRIVLALDGRTQLLMIDEYAGVRHTLALYTKCPTTETDFLCCEPLPYAHVDVIKSTMPKAFAALATDGKPWNDGLQNKLQELASRKVPPDGLEVDSAVTAARECYLRNNVLAKKYANVIFSVKRIVRVFTLAVEQGRRMGEVFYQYSLLMVHPDVSKVMDKRVREVWNNLEGVPSNLRGLIDNVRLTYDGWMVYPETGSAGVRQVQWRYTNHYIVWLGMGG